MLNFEGKDFLRCHHVETKRHAAVELADSLMDGLQNGFLTPFPYFVLDEYWKFLYVR